MDSHGGPRLQWSLNSRISSLLKKDIMSDVNFIVGDPPQTFPCHKLLLGASSEVFQVMFYGNMPEKKVVFVPDVTPEAFSTILEYFYTDKINIQTTAEAFDVAYAAKKYLLQHLYERCEQYLMSSIQLTRQNACSTYEKADFLDMKKLKEKSLHYIAKNFLKIFNSKSFPSVSKTTLSDVIQLDTLEVKSESEVVEVLCCWGLNQSKNTDISSKKPNLKNVLRDLLKHVRFSLLSVTEVKDLTKKYDIFEPDEEVSILLNITWPKKGSNLKMPLEFSNSTTRRSFSNCNRIEIPICYRYNNSNYKFSLSRQQKRALLEVARGQVTIVGVVVTLKPIPEYSKQHRRLDAEITFENLSNHTISTVCTTLMPKSEDREESWDLVLEDFLVISAGEFAQFTFTFEGEGILLPYLHQEHVTKGLKRTNVALTLPWDNGAEMLFAVKAVLCIVS